MSAESESDAFSEFLSEHLTDFTGVDAWEGVVLGGYPAISYSLLRGSDLMVVGGVRVWTEGVWQVVGETEGEGTKTGADLAGKIDEALHGLLYHDIARGCQIVDVHRVAPFRRTVTQGDTQTIIRRRGGDYRVRVRVKESA